MEPSAVREAAADLLNACRTGKPVPSPADTWPGFTVADAYAVQREQALQRAADGESLRGYRLAGGSVVSRRRWDVTEPIFGTLFADAFHPENSPIASGALGRPTAEAGIAFVLGSRLAGPGVTVVDALRAVEFVLPSLEITDSRLDSDSPAATDFIADNASAGIVVLGASPVRLSTVDIRLAGCVLYRRGSVAATGAGGAVLGSPLNALVWLANAVGAQGTVLEAGQVVLSGALTPPVAVAPGDSVMASLAGLGSVTVVLADSFSDSRKGSHD